MKDSYCRKINYMRISITDLCNLRCQYCMPENGVFKKHHKDMMSIDEIVQVVKSGAQLGIDKIRITGGEPLVKKGIIDLVEKIHSVEGIKDIAMTTNGILLKSMCKDLHSVGLNRLNISIDSLKPDKFKEITRGGNVKDVLEGIEEALSLNMTAIKLNVVVIGGYNEDEILDFVNLTHSMPVDVRFIELMPIGQASDWAKDRFISNEEIIKGISNLIPLENDSSSPAKYFKLPDSIGRVGFINPISNHFCGSCNRIRLTSDGKIKPCLHSNNEFDILEVMRTSPEDLTKYISDAILLKPQKHLLFTDSHEVGNRNMSEIGG